MTYYDAMDDLIRKTQDLIQSLNATRVEAERAAIYPSLNTERIIESLATMFWTGEPARVTLPGTR